MLLERLTQANSTTSPPASKAVELRGGGSMWATAPWTWDIDIPGREGRSGQNQKCCAVCSQRRTLLPPFLSISFTGPHDLENDLIKARRMCPLPLGNCCSGGGADNLLMDVSLWAVSFLQWEDPGPCGKGCPSCWRTRPLSHVFIVRQPRENDHHLSPDNPVCLLLRQC